jgi:hypothetical protein
LALKAPEQAAASRLEVLEVAERAVFEVEVAVAWARPLFDPKLHPSAIGSS